jgi:cytochrome c oxidase assembly protein subunit 15
MLGRLRISPERYFIVACVALVALTLIVFTGAAVRVTGSGLGCPDWPNCYQGRLVAEAHTHALIEFGNRTLSGFVAITAIAAGAMAFLRRPFRRDLAVLGVLLPLGVVSQAVLGGLTVLYGLTPGWVMSHFILSMVILVAAALLAWRSQPGFPGDIPPQADRLTARLVWAMVPLGALAVFAGTAATAAGPHAGGSGTGDVVPRLKFEGPGTLTWLVDRHGAIAAALGILSIVVWFVARRRGAVASLQSRLTRICLLLAAQGVLGIVQYRLHLPSELVWLHVALATLLWAGIVLAAVQVGAEVRAPREQRAGALSDARASAARP